MSLTSSTQASIAFKNISGKSMTDTSKGVNNEAEGVFFNLDSHNIWMSLISPTPSVAVANEVAIFVTASLTLDGTSNGRAYFASWPVTPPSGVDPTTFLPYAYGSGILTGIVANDRVRDSIPPSYGVGYEAKPYSTGPSIIPPGDPRNWIYQYNSGVFFQQDVIGSTPVSIGLYSYRGKLLSDSQQVSSSNIRVTVSGIDNYSGVATPSIATYSATDLFLIDFSNTNTGATAVTLNIDSLGPKELITFDIDGNPVGLTGGSEINTSQIYYVIWDGSNFQLFNSNPQSSSPILYTNTLGSIGVGGIAAGTTFSNATMKDMWDAILKPSYQQPNFTGFTFNHGGSTREVGNVIPAGTYSFTWGITYPANVVSNSITITRLTTPYTLISGTANDGIAALMIATTSTGLSSDGTYFWNIKAVRTSSIVISLNTSVSWYWRRFSGTQSLASLTDPQIQSLAVYPSFGNNLSSGRVGTYTFGSGGYKYFAWPTSFGAPVLFRDYSTNLAIAMAGVSEGYTISAGAYFAQVISITNIYGGTTNYYLFRTHYVLGGAITIVVT